MKPNRHRPIRGKRNSGGFTLLEILVASVLMLTLLLSMWGILDIYRGLFQTGEEKTEQSQLVRSLAQILTDDLNSAIQDPATAVSLTGHTLTSARRFGLFGTDNFMRIDVLQVPPFPVGPTSTVDEMEMGAASAVGSDPGLAAEMGRGAAMGPVAGLGGSPAPSVLQAPELRTIYYTFVDPAYSPLDAEDPMDLEQPTAAEEQPSRPGLTRRELDFETPDPEAGSADSELSSAIPHDLSVKMAEDPLGRRSFEQMLEEEPDDSVMWAPEVVGLHFRYFDGRTWRSEWNSLQRKGLPVAVEVAMKISSFDGAEAIYHAAGQAAELGLEVDAGPDQFAGDELAGTAEQGFLDPAGEAMLEPIEGTADPMAALDLPRPRVHRVVIYLPSSPLYRPPRPPKRASLAVPVAIPIAMPPAPRPVARVAVPRPTRRRSGRSFADQWMRNQP